ncbi:MAG: ATP synthase F0 subunit B [Acidobacteria bacterium]|nr:ATP synthase F0 subunit B [Acidobacteriota bacterium]
MIRSSRWAFFLLVSLAYCVAVSRSACAIPPEEPAQQEHATAGEHGGNGEGGGESHEASPIYRWINFAILVGGLAYVLRKPAAQFFAERTDSIRKSLEEGRNALAAAEQKIRDVEQKLQGFEQEMAAFRAAAMKEMEDEHARMHQATEQEAEKMMESIRVQVDVATKQARLGLRLYAAERAVAIAERVVAGRMDDVRQKRLVSQFVENVGAEIRNT